MIDAKWIKNWGRVFESPTLMTWLSFLIRSGAVVFILPMVLVHFSELEVALWLAFGVLLRVRDVLDFGMVNNVSRLIAYGHSGCKSIGDLSVCKEDTGANFLLIDSIILAARFLYVRSISISFVLLAILGSFVVWRSMSSGGHGSRAEYWLALLVHLIGCALYLWGNRYVAFLTGINKIALLKRWDALFGAATIVTLIVFLLAGSNFLSFILATNFWIVLTVIRNRIICQSSGIWGSKESVDFEVVQVVISLSKRDFLGALFGVGFLQVVNIAIVSFFPLATANSYLVLERLIEQIKAVSRAPFYTKMPIFVGCVSRGEGRALRLLARKSMLISYSVCYVGFLFVYIFGSELLLLIGVKNVVLDTRLWLFMCFAAMVDSYAAMHNQLFLAIFNKVITHVALLITMVMAIAIIWGVVDEIGVYSVPVAYIFAPLLFYAWYIPSKNYSFLNVNVFEFERNNVMAMFGFFFMVALVSWLGLGG